MWGSRGASLVCSHAVPILRFCRPPIGYSQHYCMLPVPTHHFNPDSTIHPGTLSHDQSYAFPYITLKSPPSVVQHPHSVFDVKMQLDNRSIYASGWYPDTLELVYFWCYDCVDLWWGVPRTKLITKLRYVRSDRPCYDLCLGTLLWTVLSRPRACAHGVQGDVRSWWQSWETMCMGTRSREESSRRRYTASCTKSLSQELGLPSEHSSCFRPKR